MIFEELNLANITLNYDVREDIQENITDMPDLKPYYDIVAHTIGCEIEDLCILSVHNDFLEEDEEGWEPEMFFPRGSSIMLEEMFENYETNTFCIGYVRKVTYNGKVFVAEQNASPIGMYANLKWFQDERKDGE